MSVRKRGPRWNAETAAVGSPAGARGGSESGPPWQSRWRRTRFSPAAAEAGEKHRAAWRSGAHGTDAEPPALPAWRRNISSRTLKTLRRS